MTDRAPPNPPDSSTDLPPHNLRVVLVCPQIAPNTGNIARLCVATGATLHLVRPLGFVLSEKQLRRSAMDYWPRLKLNIHDDLDAFLAFLAEQQASPWLLSSRGNRSIWNAPLSGDDWLIFGNESAGLPESMHARFHDRVIRIPQAPGERCLNLSTAAGIAVYEALRRVNPS